MYLVSRLAVSQAFLVAFCLMLTACGVGNEQGFIEAVEVNNRNLTAITVVSSNDRVRVGETESYTAMGTVEGDEEQINISSSVNWSTSDSSVVSVDSAGLATGIANGTVDIIATLSDLSGSKSLVSSDADLTSIAISNQQTDISICQTSSQQLIATGTYEDGGQATITNKVTWLSSADSIVRVGNEDLADGSRDDKGVLTGLSIGNSTITASQDDITSEGVPVSISAGLNSITVSTADQTLSAGGTSQFTAMGDYGDADTVDITNNVDWVSSETTVLTFSDTTIGLANLLVEGVTNVSAACDPAGQNIQSELLAVTVEEAEVINNLRIKEGNSSYEDESTITVDLEEGSIQLELYTLTNKENEGTTDVADEDETTWSKISDLSGEAPSISETGLVTFDAVGESEFQVRYKDDDNNINVIITFFIKVE